MNFNNTVLQNTNNERWDLLVVALPVHDACSTCYKPTSTSGPSCMHEMHGLPEIVTSIVLGVVHLLREERSAW